MNIDITSGVTDDFCECYASQSDCTGFTSRMIADEILPEGVNPADPRVIQIIQWCRENNKAETTN